MRDYILSFNFLVTFGLLIVGLVFFVAALQLPAGTFDPLGPGSVPEMVAAVIVILCSIVLIRGVRRRLTGNALPQGGAIDIIQRDGESHPRLLAGFAVLLVAYLAAFELRLGHFIVLTFPFVLASVLLLGGITRRTVVTGIIIATVLSVGLFYLLTKFFVINLPGI